MNYLTEIKLFNEWLETNELSASGVSLWYALMYIANRSGWRPELSIPISTLCLRSKLSRSGIYRERELLRLNGLLDFDVGDGRQSSNYRILGFEQRFVFHVASHHETQSGAQTEEIAEETAEVPPIVLHPETQVETQTDFASHRKTQSGTQTGTQGENDPEESAPPSHVVSHTGIQTDTQTGFASHPETQAGTQPDFVSHTGTQSGTIYKHKQDISIDEKNKEIKKGGTGEKKKAAKFPKKKKADFDLSFVGDPAWENLVRIWLDYKQSRREDYKSELSVKKFHTMLRNLSHDNPAAAGRIIDKSIANNWAGIFELTDAAVKPSGSPAVGQRIGQIKQPADEEHRRKLLEKFGSSKK